MTISVIGFSQFLPDGLKVNPLLYKTDVFEVSSGTAISEIYDYFRTNPQINWMVSDSISHNWGDQITGPVTGYTQVNNTWKTTEIPSNPMVLLWNIYECDSLGYNPSYIADLTTPLNNITHYEGL